MALRPPPCARPTTAQAARPQSYSEVGRPSPPPAAKLATMPAWFTHMLNDLQDKAMFALIGRNIIYNVSWEDPRIDCEVLDLGADDTILMLTSGGCNVLDMLLEGPKRIVAADLNPRQSALLSLKIVAIQHLSHEQFFQLFAKSNLALWKDVYPRVLREHLPQPAREFWDAAGERFFKSVLWGGASGFAAWLMLTIAKWLGLGGLIAGEPVIARGSLAALSYDAFAPPPPRPPHAEARHCATLEEQQAVYAKYSGRVTALANMMNFTRRIWCPLIAVPASQVWARARVCARARCPACSTPPPSTPFRRRSCTCSTATSSAWRATTCSCAPTSPATTTSTTATCTASTRASAAPATSSRRTLSS